MYSNTNNARTHKEPRNSHATFRSVPVSSPGSISHLSWAHCQYSQHAMKSSRGAVSSTSSFSQHVIHTKNDTYTLPHKHTRTQRLSPRHNSHPYFWMDKSILTPNFLETLFPLYIRDEQRERPYVYMYEDPPKESQREKHTHSTYIFPALRFAKTTNAAEATEAATVPDTLSGVCLCRPVVHGCCTCRRGHSIPADGTDNGQDDAEKQLVRPKTGWYSCANGAAAYVCRTGAGACARAFVLDVLLVVWDWDLMVNCGTAERPPQQTTSMRSHM